MEAPASRRLQAMRTRASAVPADPSILADPAFSVGASVPPDLLHPERQNDSHTQFATSGSSRGVAATGPEG